MRGRFRLLWHGVELTGFAFEIIFRGVSQYEISKSTIDFTTRVSGGVAGVCQGLYLYIPTKKENYKKWGELSGFRSEIDCRNEKIRNAYNNGVSVKEIATQFFISIYAVRKIIYNNKSEDS